jgi:hypothetical protein
MKTILLIALAGGAAAMSKQMGHGNVLGLPEKPSTNDLRTCADATPYPEACVRPGTCSPPAHANHAIAVGPAPGLQWDFSGGFCGSFSVQQGALSAGAWVSQDLVRKANRGQPGVHNMHGDGTVGYEVMPSNVAWTADHLKLIADEFDYNQPKPQAAAWKKWAKSHLVKAEPIVFFPMCKGDQHQCYPGSCPNGGACDHVESMYGIYSNHSLDDPTVYDDDVVVHTSNQDCFPYYRKMGTLQDSKLMLGNCGFAQPGFGRNEMYPCIDQSVTYGLAVTGLRVNGTAGRTALTVDVKYEPNIRGGDSPSLVSSNVTVTGLVPNAKYTILRYVGTAALPAGPPFSSPDLSQPVTADAAGNAVWSSPPPFKSDLAVYHFTVPVSEILIGKDHGRVPPV